MTERTYDVLDRPEVQGVLFYPRRDIGVPRLAAGVHNVRIPVEGNVCVGSRIFAAATGSPVVVYFHGNGEIGSDYDAAQVRLTGNVHGDPPFRGTLEHGGWRVTDIKLPELTGGGFNPGQPYYFNTVTPAGPNAAPSSQGKVADTKFAPNRGFYDVPVQVAITTVTAFGGAGGSFFSMADSPIGASRSVPSKEAPCSIHRATVIISASGSFAAPFGMRS